MEADIVELFDSRPRLVRRVGHVMSRRYREYICGGPEPLVVEGCPTHTPAPRGYLAWHEWAEEMGKTHQQTRCPDCGLLAIWEPK